MYLLRNGVIMNWLTIFKKTFSNKDHSQPPFDIETVMLAIVSEYSKHGVKPSPIQLVLITYVVFGYYSALHDELLFEAEFHVGKETIVIPKANAVLDKYYDGNLTLRYDVVEEDDLDKLTHLLSNDKVYSVITNVVRLYSNWSWDMFYASTRQISTPYTAHRRALEQYPVIPYKAIKAHYQIIITDPNLVTGL